MLSFLVPSTSFAAFFLILTFLHHRPVPTGSASSTHIKPFKDEVLCDVSPLEVCDVILGQPYMWKHHVVYESQPCSVIVTLGGHLYKIPEVVPTTSISLISKKMSQSNLSNHKVFPLHDLSEGEQKVTATTTTSPKTFLYNRSRSTRL
jgi:hypothetical protein